MSSRAARTPHHVRQRRSRREAPGLDLNRVPPSAFPEQHRNIIQDPPRGRTNQHQQHQHRNIIHDPTWGRANQHQQHQQPVPIDVDAIDDDDDDDVVLSSPTAFAEARIKTMMNRVRSILSVVSEDKNARSGHSHRSRPRRANDSASVTARAPEGPSFSCPICLCDLVDSTATKCGHIFCKGCVEAAVAAQRKCPICRKPVGSKDLIRIYLPDSA